MQRPNTLGILMAIIMVAGSGVLLAQDKSKTEPKPVTTASPAPTPEAKPDPTPTPFEGIKPVTTDSGLKYYDIKVGKGESPRSGAEVTVHYSGWLTDGKLFDSSVKRGKPFTFRTHTGVIPGWIEEIGRASCRERV